MDISHLLLNLESYMMATEASTTLASWRAPSAFQDVAHFISSWMVSQHLNVPAAPLLCFCSVLCILCHGVCLAVIIPVASWAHEISVSKGISYYVSWIRSFWGACSQTPLSKVKYKTFNNWWGMVPVRQNTTALARDFRAPDCKALFFCLPNVGRSKGSCVRGSCGEGEFPRELGNLVFINN